MLKPVRGPEEVPEPYRKTPIEDLLAYHNWGETQRSYAQADLLVGMCMDHRKRLRIPENFAYVMRAAGANFRGLEFQMSFAISVGGVRAMAIIGHDQCGMSGLDGKRDAIINGLIDGAGWERDAAERHFDECAPSYEIGDPVKFTLAQVQGLRQQFPEVVVASLFYELGDGMLRVID